MVNKNGQLDLIIINNGSTAYLKAGTLLQQALNG